MAEILRVIEPISNQKFIRRIETNELRVVLQLFRNAFVKQSANLQRPRPAFLQYSHQTIQSAARINDIFDQQYVLSLEPCFRVVNQVHGTTGDRPITVTRGDEEIDLKRTADLANEVAEKDEASFEQTEHQQVAVGISGGDLPAELSDAARDCTFIERNALDGSP